jgi:PAS domain S-box-containing protein
MSEQIWIFISIGVANALLLAAIARAHFRAQAALRASEAKVRRVVDGATIGVAFSDGHGLVTDANDAFLTLVGATRDDLKKNAVRWTAITPLEYAPLDEKARSQLMSTGLQTPYEKEYLRRDGTRVPVLVATTDVDVERKIFVSFVIDLTHQKKTERERIASFDREREARAEAELLNRVGLTLSAELDADRLIAAIIEAAVEITGARLGEFREKLDPGFAESANLRSFIDVPVLGRSGETVGSFIFGHPEPNRFNKHHERVVRGLAAQAAVAMDNARLYRANEDARREAEAASRTKDEFLAIVSHELRTPLNAILGWSQLLRSGTFAPEQAEHGLETLERNARVQAQLIDDLLDVSRITSGKLRLEMQRLDPLLAVESALESVRPASEAKEIEIRKSIHAIGGGLVFGDAGRLQQIVWNLLSNAIKFTPRGGKLYLGVHLAPQGLEISVGDNGLGIRAEFLPLVFERFRQADASSTRQFGGLGLGLAIVRHLVELHGGTVRAESPGIGHGATFTVTLPVVFPSESSPGPQIFRHAIDETRLSGVRVLVVDDDPDTRELLSLMLAEAHAIVETAGSVQEALRAMVQTLPHVLISDIGMPNEDGYELIRRIRKLSSEQGGAIPAIAVTAFVRREDRLRALQEGFQAHVGKPVEPDALRTLVAQLAGARELNPLRA